MSKKCYITTPIYYSSGNVQIGNAYTTVAADIMARFYRSLEHDTFFLTGMDEHGQKIEEAAAKQNMTPTELVDKIAIQTKEVWKKLGVTFDEFIRTTDYHHVRTVQKIFEKLLAQDDIYLGHYSGHYCVSCETFFPKAQLGENDTCPDCGKPTRIVKEESYFLRLKKYSQRLLDYIKNNPDFIVPETRKNEVVSFIESGLEDLSISRTTFNWGIPVISNPKHVVYVWIDALLNYLTGLHYMEDDDSLYQSLWVNNKTIYQIVGKDILRFHAIFWPIILFALDVPMNFRLYVHGWLLTNDGGKMSKSKGNAVYPSTLINRYGRDAVRYYLAKELPLGNDGIFSTERFVERYNSDLANDLGNLVSRTLAMIEKYFGGSLELTQKTTRYDDLLIDYQSVVKEAIIETIADYKGFKLQGAINRAMTIVSRSNKLIDETAPWVLAKNGETDCLVAVLSNLAEGIRIASALLRPVLIDAANEICHSFGITELPRIADLSFELSWKVNVVKGGVLFERKVLADELAFFTPVAVKPLEVKPLVEFTQFQQLDLRVGEIKECIKHPKAEKLLVLQIEIAGTIRQIVSGIAKEFKPESLIGKKVVVLINIPEVTLRGVVSNGMILCAENEEDGVLELLELNNVKSGAKVS